MAGNRKRRGELNPLPCAYNRKYLSLLALASSFSPMLCIPSLFNMHRQSTPTVTLVISVQLQENIRNDEYLFSFEYIQHSDCMRCESQGLGSFAPGRKDPGFVIQYL